MSAWIAASWYVQRLCDSSNYATTLLWPDHATNLKEHCKHRASSKLQLSPNWCAECWWMQVAGRRSEHLYSLSFTLCKRHEKTDLEMLARLSFSSSGLLLQQWSAWLCEGPAGTGERTASRILCMNAHMAAVWRLSAGRRVAGEQQQL